VTIRNSKFERLDGNAVMVSGYNRNATIDENDFSFLGGNAVVAWGYTNETENSGFPYYTPNTNHPKAGVDGTDGNHPRFTRVSRNSAREVGLYEKQSSFFMSAKAAQTTIVGNVFFNGPRAGINYNDGFGGGDELSENLVFSTCRESGDHGPFNSWDRQPYLTTVRTGKPSMVMAWRAIHHNFFIDNYSPQEAVDNDDGSSFYRTHDNFFVYGAQGMKSDFGGHDNHHENNIYAYVGRALGTGVSPLQNHSNLFANNKVFMTGIDVGHFKCDGVGHDELHDNEYYTMTGFVTECGMSLKDWQANGTNHDARSVVKKFTSNDDLLALGKVKLGLSTPTVLV